MAKIIIPSKIFGIDSKEALERIMNEPENTEPPTPPAGTPPTPARDIASPGSYIVLPGKRHLSYSYPDLLVSKEVYHKGYNWNQCQEELGKEGAFMLTMRQFVDFLSLLKSPNAIYDGKGNQIDGLEALNIYNEITAVRDPYRAEWLDASFKVINGQLSINYEHRIVNGVITPGITELLESCLMEDKKPGINLEGWLNTANKHGLPLRTTTGGNLYYYFPRSDNNSVARFGAGSDGASLSCDGDPANASAGLGVRRVFLYGK